MDYYAAGQLTDAAVALRKAINEYANALYSYNVVQRGINPVGAYNDAAGTLTADLKTMGDDARMEIQYKAASAER